MMRARKPITCVILMLGCWLYSPVRAGLISSEWVITVETEEFPGELKYAGSKLNPLVKANIKYGSIDGSNERDYETLWFCRGKIFGLERNAPLSIPPQTIVGVKVLHRGKKTGRYEFAAAAQSILRIYADLWIHNCMLDGVVVPDEYFSDVLDTLSKEHFEPIGGLSENPLELPPPLFLRDQSLRQAENMSYVPQDFSR